MSRACAWKNGATETAHLKRHLQFANKTSSMSPETSPMRRSQRDQSGRYFLPRKKYISSHVKILAVHDINSLE